MSPEDAELYAALYAERNLRPPRRELPREERAVLRAQAAALPNRLRHPHDLKASA